MTDVLVAGWELRNTSSTHYKFYRVFLTKQMAWFQYGRIGTTGQWVFDATGIMPPSAALRKALEQARTKGANGYQMATSMVVLRLDQHDFDDIVINKRDSGVLPTIHTDFTKRATTLSPALRVDTAQMARDFSTASTPSTPPTPPAAAPAVPPARPAGTRRRIKLAPVGPSPRPNGQIYQPREAGGHEDLAVLRLAQARRQHVLLEGPPGTGKSALADSAFPGCVQLVCTRDTTVADLVGGFMPDADGTFQWVPGPLQRSIEADVPLFIDEIGLPDPSELAVLYPLMDGRDTLAITANPALAPLTLGKNWFVVGAYNADVPGVNMSDALLDRFSHHLYVPSDFDLAESLGVPAKIITVARNLDEKRRKGTISWSPQLRTLLTFRDLAEDFGEDYAVANLISRAPKHDQEQILTAMKAHWSKASALQLGRTMTA